MPNRKKPNTLFLPARIKRLMQKDEEVGKLSATVPVIAARALEQFLEELITRTASITVTLQAKTLTPEHIRQHIYSDSRLAFLHELANRMATGPNSNARTLSTSSSTSTPTPSTMHRPSFQTQLSVAYQDPVLPTTSSNPTNLLYLNQQLSRSYSNPCYTKVKSNKRNFDLVDEVQEADDDDDDDDEVEDNGDDNEDETYLPTHT